MIMNVGAPDPEHSRLAPDDKAPPPIFRDGLFNGSAMFDQPLT
jgi:hypothetical protein